MSEPSLAQTINSPCSSYMSQSKYWPVCRALIEGTPGMRAAKKTYLPQEPKESDAAYENRLNRSTLYNAFSKAVNSLSGKILENGVKIEESTPQEIKDILEYVDESGRDVERFIHDVVIDAMIIGRSHVLVEFPVRPVGVVSKDDEKKAGLLPYWVHVKAEDLIYWKLKKGQLTEIRIRELNPTDETQQIRRLTPTDWEIWQQKDGKKEFELIDKGINTLGEIPLATFYTRRLAEMVTRPPLEDLAYKNVEHWQSSSDQRHILHVARVPILFSTGFDDDDEVVIGPNQLISGPSGSDLKYVEHTGAGIAAGQEDLKSIEAQMAILAMEPILQSKSGNQTATARAMDGADAQAAIKLTTSDIEDAADLCLGFTAKWLGMTPEQAGGLEIQCDFSLLTQDSAGLIELGKARALGDISREGYLKEFKRRGILSEEFDIKADKARVDKENEELNSMTSGIDPLTPAPASGIIKPKVKTVAPQPDGTYKVTEE